MIPQNCSTWCLGGKTLQLPKSAAQFLAVIPLVNFLISNFILMGLLLSLKHGFCLSIYTLSWPRWHFAIARFKDHQAESPRSCWTLHCLEPTDWVQGTDSTSPSRLLYCTNGSMSFLLPTYQTDGSFITICILKFLVFWFPNTYTSPGIPSFPFPLEDSNPFICFVKGLSCRVSQNAKQWSF